MENNPFLRVHKSEGVSFFCVLYKGQCVGYMIDVVLQTLYILGTWWPCVALGRLHETQHLAGDESCVRSLSKHPGGEGLPC